MRDDLVQLEGDVEQEEAIIQLGSGEEVREVGGQPPEYIVVVRGPLLLGRRFWDVSEGITAVASDGVDVEFGRCAATPFEVEQRRDLLAIPEDVLEGEITMNEVGGREILDQRSPLRHCSFDEVEQALIGIGRPPKRAYGEPERPQGRTAAVVEQVRAAPQGRDSRRHWSVMQIVERFCQLSDGEPAIARRHCRPASRQRLARSAGDDQIVGADVPAMAEDSRSPRPNRQFRTQLSLSAQPLIGFPVDPHDVVAAHEDFVPRAVRPNNLAIDREPSLLESTAGSGDGEGVGDAVHEKGEVSGGPETPCDYRRNCARLDQLDVGFVMRGTNAERYRGTASTASLKAGHASAAHDPNSRSVSATVAILAIGSTQSIVPARPK